MMSILQNEGRITSEDLLIFAFRREKTFFKDFAILCNNEPGSKGKTRLARQTMSNYLRDLIKDDCLRKDIGPQDKYRYYFVPKEKHREVVALEERRRTDLEFRNKSSEEQAAIVEKSLYEKDKQQIFRAIATNGWLTISELTDKTGIDDQRLLEIIWGRDSGEPLPVTSLFFNLLLDADDKHTSPRIIRSYGLSFKGTYRALQLFPDAFDEVINHWSSIHPFILSRFPMYRKHGVEEDVRLFLEKLDPINFSFMQGEAIKDLEDGLIAKIPRNGKTIPNWFNLLLEDQEFRERAKRHYQDGIEYYKERIGHYQYALRAMDNLSSRKPDQRQMRSDMSVFVGIL
jgi:DNA-binding MarR family transcriptional regulator